MRTVLKRISVAILLAMSLTSSNAAQEDEARHRFSGDVFWGGREVRITEADIEDVFAAGETVTIESEVRESAHLAGRLLRIDGGVGQDLYAAGFSIDVMAPVGGDVIAAGYRVEIGRNGSVGEDMLAAGQSVLVRGPVGGDAVLTGNIVEIAAPISGSVEIRASQIRFAEGARIDGTLAYWSDTEVTVPATVIPAERVVGQVIEREALGAVSLLGLLIGGLIVLFLLLVLAIVFAFLFRRTLVRTRETLAARPWRTLFLGLVATSALFGSILVLAVSLIGIPLVPLILVLIPFALAAGYLTTAHAIGGLLVGRMSGADAFSAFVAILLGLAILWLVGLIPILGWVIAVSAVVIGLGAWFSLLVASSRTPVAAATAP